ncbi:MAG: isoprenylcysteine carboxylmethyltransferase family protein [Candidatus Nitrohelix vancouverensis]|uniref:Isoprenylcysteine carboxylmethyltransferase family protein n=1 Tax=Candidatus Nitrohelix vancouverensis TaxID=2705534 RepID=A0A7T0C3B8_9BACT|nr:MAG: isoprenylcysteine carboxylmethyltransferase family protein [Candidatus Nitrohelix vancouverensis]
MIESIIYFNFIVFVAAFAFALWKNCNATTLQVGAIYLAPLIPVGLDDAVAERFLIVSLLNFIFGIIELVLFVKTVRPGDASLSKDYFRQLFGHTLPIAAALVGASFIARASEAPVGFYEGMALALIFIAGAVLRVVAVWQIGALGFKFDIVFREEQTLKNDQLYALMRHPSYTGMMLVILAYAINTHSWIAGTVTLLVAWFGFQFRIHYEEKALEAQFGEPYREYRERTSMWIPFVK